MNMRHGEGDRQTPEGALFGRPEIVVTDRDGVVRMRRWTNLHVAVPQPEENPPPKNARLGRKTKTP